MTEEIVWYDDSIVEKLKQAEILTLAEVNSLPSNNNVQDIQKEILKFIKIRTDRSFYIFCNLLKVHSNPVVQQFGHNLRENARSADDHSIDGKTFAI